MSFEKLFSPIQIRGVELRNRAVMSAMGTHLSIGSDDGRKVTDKLIAYHVARAKGGCGLNTVEVCSVDTASAPKGFLSLSDDCYIAGMKKLCDEIHAAGGKAALQLWQGGFAVASDTSVEILLPSEMPLSPEYTVPGISVERIHSIIEAYGKAAKRAVQAGFDIVEFHCAHNYLPHSFLSGGINRRTDEWGGSLENRMRFPLACIEEIRANIPETMPLFMRVGWQDDMLENGLTPEEVITFCKEAGTKGVDVLNISRGNIMTAATIYEVAPVDIPNGFNVEPAARIRRETGMLVMPCGRINTPELAEEILEKDQADLIVLARAQLADPEFCNKAKEGRLSSITYCIGCDQGCYDYFCASLADPAVEHITCMRNPAVCEESIMSITKTDVPKKVLIAGGGIAGIEAAGRLYQKGHKPVLYEASDHLGGQFLLAGIAPGKSDFIRAGKMAIKNLEDLGIEIHLNTPVTPEIIEKEQPDHMIIAVGSSPLIPKIDGWKSAIVKDSREVLTNTSITAQKVVVIGGGLVGIEVAEYMTEKGAEVTVIEMRPSILDEMGILRKTYTQMEIAKKKINIMLNTTCKEIKDTTVLVETKEGMKELSADLVVMAVGSTPNPLDELKTFCEEKRIPCHVVGDAKAAPRLALNAIHEAYQAVMEI